MPATGPATTPLRRLTFAGPLLGQRERLLGTHVRRGVVLAIVLLAVASASFSTTSDVPGLELLSALMTWNTVVLGLVGATAGAEAFSAEHARGGGALLRLAETRPLPMAANLLAAQVSDLLLLVAAQGPLMLLCLTLGGVTASHVVSAVVMLCSWVLLAAAVSGWFASTGMYAFFAVAMAAVTVGVGEVMLMLVSMASGVELCLSPFGHESLPLIPPQSAAINAAVQLLTAAGFLLMAGHEAVRFKEDGTPFVPDVPPTPTAALQPARRPHPTAGVAERAAAQTSARPRIDVCPHRWKGMQLHVGGGDGVAVRSVVGLVLVMLFSLMSQSLTAGLTSAGVMMLYWDASLLTARRVRTELEGDPELIRLLPAGRTHAAVETRRGVVPAFGIPIAVILAGAIATVSQPVDALPGDSLGLDVLFAALWLATALLGVPIAARVSGMFATKLGVARSVVSGLAIVWLVRTIGESVLMMFAVSVFGVFAAATAGLLAAAVWSLVLLLVLRAVGPRDPFFHTLVHGRLGRWFDLLPKPQRTPS